LDEHKNFQAAIEVGSDKISNFQVCLEYQLAQALINRATGGKGNYINSDKKLTDIETVILENLSSSLVKDYQGSWKNVFKLNNEPNKIVSPLIKTDEKIKKSDEVVVFTIMISIGEQLPTAINIVFANVDFEKLVGLYQREQEKLPKQLTVKLLPESVSNVITPVQVELGTTAVGIADLLKLNVGDVFQLNQKVNDNVILKIGPKAVFYGKLGRVGYNYAVKIVDVRGKYYEIKTEPQSAPVAGKEIQQNQQTADLTDAELLDSAQEDVDRAFESESEQKQEADEDVLADDFTDSQPAELEDKPVDDPLLKEFADEKDEDDAEFVWDIDDL
jgi:flagellar motor switch/type III secretory pathway protein FliN